MKRKVLALLLRSPWRQWQQQGRRLVSASLEAAHRRETEATLATPRTALGTCVKCEGAGTVLVRTRRGRHERRCETCGGSGLRRVEEEADSERRARVAIAGGGISGLALALALEHRGIGVRVFERDADFFSRESGYGLTLQQGGKALKGLGQLELVRSRGSWTSKHLALHARTGRLLGRHGAGNQHSSTTKNYAIHVPRQCLRAALLSQLRTDVISWDADASELTGYDLIVGADGLRSPTRRRVFGDVDPPLAHSGLAVVLGRAPADVYKDEVFEVVDGFARLYAMPFDARQTMWQLSFPFQDTAFPSRDKAALKEIAQKTVRAWAPFSRRLVDATPVDSLTGYPLVDRFPACLPDDRIRPIRQNNDGQRVVLLGDAAHPMLPFKAQGANQALLDSLRLARLLSRTHLGTSPPSIDLDDALQAFYAEMRPRADAKIHASRSAATLLHSPAACVARFGLTRAAAARAHIRQADSSEADEPEEEARD